MNTDIPVLYEDDFIAVVDKPAGLIVNRSDTVKGILTLQDFVERKINTDLPQGVEDTSSDFFARSGIVHRLDKETSGLLIVAKDEDSFKNLQKQFKERTVKKVYTTLVRGRVPESEGHVDAPVGRLPWNRKKFGVFAEGRESQTLYKLKGYYQMVIQKEAVLFSLLEVYPQTGRTHQIRVHMRYAGFPVVSDELYGGRKHMKKERRLLPRHFLHATKIKFVHPHSGKAMNFESQLPTDLQKFLAECEHISV